MAFQLRSGFFPFVKWANANGIHTNGTDTGALWGMGEAAWKTDFNRCLHLIFVLSSAPLTHERVCLQAISRH